MIGVEELKIGSIVQYNGQSCRVTSIEEQSGQYHIGIEDGGTGRKVPLDDIHGIQLSERLLINNGFNEARVGGKKRLLYNGARSTYFLLEDSENAGKYYIGMEDYGDDRRVSRSFSTLHELQEAWFVVRNRALEF